MEIGLGIFAKTAELSPVKTRLAASIGEEKAREFYYLSVKAVEEIAQNLPATITPHWAVAEQEALSHPQWQNLARFWTGEGGLGQRLNQVYSHLQQSHGAAMLMGTDSPQLSPSLLKQAQDRLSQNPSSIVIGPCDDGGFYLFAAAVKIPQEVWTSVKYSQNSTLEQLEKALKEQGFTIHHLPKQQDVDIAEDLQKLSSTLTARKNLLANQQRLLDWLNRTATTA